MYKHIFLKYVFKDRKSMSEVAVGKERYGKW